LITKPSFNQGGQQGPNGHTSNSTEQGSRTDGDQQGGCLLA
jgi:hypothetical protein